jgi:hypothetical protein
MKLDSALINEWASPGDTQKSVATYNRLKSVIESRFPNYHKDIYLQGSYGNHTNIKGSSDVDVVVQFDIVERDLAIVLDWFYDNIQGAGNFYFTKGHKTIKYAGSNDYVKVDIVPCITYDSGILIYDHAMNKKVYNNPKKHIIAGETKNKDTDGQYKQIVRVLKNARNHLFDSSLRNMPSFKIECMAYNVSNIWYTGNTPSSYSSVVTNLYYQSLSGSLSDMKEPGTNQLVFPDQVSLKKASDFISAIKNQME